MKVAVYAICGPNEDPETVRRMARSTAEAELLIVGATGWSDGVRVVGAEGGKVTQINIKPFRFDDARNATLALVPPDVDVCIALDMDEVLMPGWRDALEKAWVPGTNQLDITYRWNETKTFLHNQRVHSRYGWRWRHPGHEAIYPWMMAPGCVECPEFVIEHHPDRMKPRPNILELMAWGQWEEPDSLRMIHYYGRELMFNAYYKEALDMFDRYMKKHGDGPEWSEVNDTRAYIAVCLNALRGLGLPTRRSC